MTIAVGVLVVLLRFLGGGQALPDASLGRFHPPLLVLGVLVKKGHVVPLLHPPCQVREDKRHNLLVPSAQCRV